MTSLACGTSAAGESQKQFKQLGRGPGPAGLWSHEDFRGNQQKMTRSTETGQSSTWKPILDIRTSRSGQFKAWTRKLRSEMKGVNALHLELPESKLPREWELELGRKSPQRSKQWYLARLTDLKQTTFPPRWSQDSKPELQDVKSDSGSSVASSVAARKFWESMRECDSLEEDEPCGFAPTCSSLKLGSGDDKESVSSTSSVA